MIGAPFTAGQQHVSVFVSQAGRARLFFCAHWAACGFFRGTTGFDCAWPVALSLSLCVRARIRPIIFFPLGCRVPFFLVGQATKAPILEMASRPEPAARAFVCDITRKDSCLFLLWRIASG